MASSQFGANTAGEWRQKRCLKPVGVRGISSPLFRESLIDTWGLVWRTRDNSSIVSLFSESRRLSTAVSLQGAWLASKLELSLLIFAEASPSTARLCLWHWVTTCSTWYNLLLNIYVMLFFQKYDTFSEKEISCLTATCRMVWDWKKTFTNFEDVICCVFFYKNKNLGFFLCHAFIVVVDRCRLFLFAKVLNTYIFAFCLLWLQHGWQAQDKFPTLWNNKVNLNCNL